jgi:Flp pilus assembly protein TadG
MRQRLRSLAADIRGATAVEFSLVIVPFVLLLTGGLEYGRLLWTKSALAETAIVGARCFGMLQKECASGGVLSTTAGTTYIIAQAARSALSLTSSNIAITTSATCGGVSGFVSVTIGYTFTSPFMPFINGQPSIALSESACFPASS